MSNGNHLEYEAIGNRQSASGNPFLWAFYLGISWTWVIGMFLPVLLIRDYGPLAWLIFAVPNCIGAAAMGWVMRSAHQSEELVARHSIACSAFSLVTIAFHVYVALWLMPRLLGTGGWVVSLVLIQAAFTPMARRRGAPWWSVATFAASMAIAVIMARRGLLLPPLGPSISVGDSIGLAAVCMIGFVACPYFDLSFHRARQSTSDAGAKFAFGVGFMVIFGSMIVFTALYFGFLCTFLFGGYHGTEFSGQLSPASPGAILLAIHIGLQSLFTVSMHSGTYFDDAAQRDPQSADARVHLGFALAIAFVLGVAQHLQTNVWSATYAGLSFGEIYYRIFMSFYGLVFPAYALTSMLRGRPRWKETLVAIGIALPFYWLAFIERHMVWAIVGVGVVVAIGFFWRPRPIPAT